MEAFYGSAPKFMKNLVNEFMNVFPFHVSHCSVYLFFYYKPLQIYVYNLVITK